MSRSWRVWSRASELPIGFEQPAHAMRSARQPGQSGLSGTNDADSTLIETGQRRTLRADPNMRDLDRLEKQLLGEFCPPLPPDEVRGRLLACVASYHAAVVRTYLPLLIELTTREQLRALVANRNV